MDRGARETRRRRKARQEGAEAAYREAEAEVDSGKLPVRLHETTQLTER